jgi:hypothetical protein
MTEFLLQTAKTEKPDRIFPANLEDIGYGG